MSDSVQDRHYRDVEGDAFFERNSSEKDASVLRSHKRSLAETIAAAGVKPQRVLEYGCHYGDLLHHYAKDGAECHGVEASLRAVEFGRKSYGDAITLHHGTIAQNAVNADEAFRGYFDLVIVEDVFCWVSRETLLQSIANVDAALADGGHLFIREFAPLQNSKNPNHHVDGPDVYCFKPAMTHAQMLTGTGIYTPIYQKTWMDQADAWIISKGGDPFQSRWSDAVLRKSFLDYYR